MDNFKMLCKAAIDSLIEVFPEALTYTAGIAGALLLLAIVVVFVILFLQEHEAMLRLMHVESTSSDTPAPEPQHLTPELFKDIASKYADADDEYDPDAASDTFPDAEPDTAASAKPAAAQPMTEHPVAEQPTDAPTAEPGPVIEQNEEMPAGPEPAQQEKPIEKVKYKKQKQPAKHPERRLFGFHLRTNDPTPDIDPPMRAPVQSTRPGAGSYFVSSHPDTPVSVPKSVLDAAASVPAEHEQAKAIDDTQTTENNDTQEEYTGPLRLVIFDSRPNKMLVAVYGEKTGLIMARHCSKVEPFILEERDELAVVGTDGSVRRPIHAFAPYILRA